MFNELIPQIPLTEAADFFYRIKHAGWEEAPDHAGTLEGQFVAPIEQVLQQVTTIATAKFRIMVAYYTYGESMRDLAQHPIGEVFREHAGHELEAAEYYLKRAAVLGGAIHLESIEPPPASTDPIHIIQTMIRAEQEAIANQRHLRELVGDDNPMRIEIEEKMVQDQHHLDELWQMLPSELHEEGGGDAAVGVEAPVPAGDAAVPVAEAAGPAAGKPVAKTAMSLEAVRALKAKLKTAADKTPPTDAELREVGRQRAVAQLSAEAHREKGRHGERAGETLGRIGGAVGGAAAGRRLIGGRAGTIAGLAAGYAAGGKAGKELGAERDIRKNAAAMRFKLASIKLGFGPDLGTYMMAEQAGQQAQGQAEADFYREKLRSTEEASAATQQQIADMQAQLQQLMAEKEQVGATIQAASQEASMARDDALAQTQAAANMRIGYQKLRQQIIDAASQDPEMMAGGLPGDLPPGSGNGIEPAMQPGMPGASPEATAPGAVPAEAGGPGAPGDVQNASGKQPGPNPTAQPGQALKTAADLTAASREQIKPKNFALSARQSDTGKPAYPIHDRAHAANALARVRQHGSPVERSEVYRDVARKFPELASRSDVPAVRAKVKEAGTRDLGRKALEAGKKAVNHPRAETASTVTGALIGAGTGAAKAVSDEDKKDKRDRHPVREGLRGGLKGTVLGGAIGSGTHRLARNLSSL